MMLNLEVIGDLAAEAVVGERAYFRRNDILQPINLVHYPIELSSSSVDRRLLSDR